MTDLDQKAWAEAVRHVHDGNPLWIALADNALATEGARALIAAYLAALPPSPAVVPDGWKLVPVEPTLMQQNAGWAEVDLQGFATEDTEMAPIYRAMLAAAPPSPPALDGAGRDAVIEECAKVADAAAIAAERVGTRGLRLTRKHEDRRIAAAIRSLKETRSPGNGDPSPTADRQETL